jgi:EmrB/QacA subfamily drug resistance transporter
MLGLRRAPCEAGVIAAVPVASGCAERSKPWVLAATILGSSMASIDGTAVNIALPVIERDLGASVAAMQWVINAYSLMLAALMLIGGSAGDRYGRRKVFLSGVAIFTAASICCGGATSATALVLARSVQGVGGALLIPSNLAIIGATFSEQERGRAIGTWAAFAAVTAALGPVLGGWLADAVSWRAIFLVNAPLALVTALITLRHMPESRDHHAPPRLDWRGTVLAACALAAIAFGLIQSSDLGWRHPAVLTALILGPVLFAAFLRMQARSDAPLVPLSLFRSASFSGVNMLTLLLYAALGGVFFLLPFDLIQARGYTAVSAGAAFLPFTVIIGALSRWSGGLMDRFGARGPLILGPLIAALGFALLARPGLAGSYWIDFFPPMAVLGLGMAISIAPLTTTVLNAVGEDRAGIASGINNAVSEVASLLAVALFGAVGLAVFGRALDAEMATLALSPAALGVLDIARDTLAAVAIPDTVSAEDGRLVAELIGSSFLKSFRLLMIAASMLALASALCAALTIAPTPSRRG